MKFFLLSIISLIIISSNSFAKTDDSRDAYWTSGWGPIANGNRPPNALCANDAQCGQCMVCKGAQKSGMFSTGTGGTCAPKPVYSIWDPCYKGSGAAPSNNCPQGCGSCDAGSSWCQNLMSIHTSANTQLFNKCCH